jgi:hypothetical protein
MSPRKKTKARGKPTARRKKKQKRPPWLGAVVGVALVLMVAMIGLLKWSESRTGQTALLSMGSEKMFGEVQTAIDEQLAPLFPGWHSGPVGPGSAPGDHDWPADEFGSGAGVWCRVVSVPADVPYRHLSWQISQALEPLGARVLWSQRLYPDQPSGAQTQPSEELDLLRLDLGVPGRPTHTVVLHRQGKEAQVRWGAGPGVTAWSALAARNDAPLVALVIDDWGYAKTTATRQLINLPVPLTMAVLPGLSYSREFALEKTDLVLPPDLLKGAAGVGQRAAPGRIERLAAGCFVEVSVEQPRTRSEVRRREILLHLPMQPEGYPETNPGNEAIMVGMSRTDMEVRVDKALNQLDRVTGVNNHMGSAATSDPATMDNLMAVLEDRGLLFLDSLTSARSVAYDAARQQGIPALKNRLFLDYDNEDEQKITAKLNRLVQAARSTGYAVGIGHPHPATARVLAREIPRLVAEGVVFVTVSEMHALVDHRQKVLP